MYSLPQYGEAQEFPPVPIGQQTIAKCPRSESSEYVSTYFTKIEKGQGTGKKAQYTCPLNSQTAVICAPFHNTGRHRRFHLYPGQITLVFTR